MQEIASDAGVAVGTLYLYFKQQGRAGRGLRRGVRRPAPQQAARSWPPTRPADEKLRHYVLHRFRRSDETRTGSRHAAEITRAVLRVKPDRIVEEGQMMWEVVVQILAEGVEAGVFHDRRPGRRRHRFSCFRSPTSFPTPCPISRFRAKGRFGASDRVVSQGLAERVWHDGRATASQIARPPQPACEAPVE